MNHGHTLSAEWIKAEALRLGFSACGLAPAHPVDERCADDFRQWRAQGFHAGMQYLERYDDVRFNPENLLPGARTVVSVALNYFPAERPAPRAPQIAWYAYGKDYHDVMRRKLQQLFDILRTRHPEVEGRLCCDTAPVPERYWAVQAGVGFIGLNGQLIVPNAGSAFFLGELFLTAESDAYDRALQMDCVRCRRCLIVCPTKALQGDGTLDARRCLSYLTIEHRGPLPEGIAPKLFPCFYGCDRCQQVCPHLREATPTVEPDLQPYPDLLAMTADDWRSLSPDRYRTLFKGSAVKRAKYEGLLRNLRALFGEEG